MSHLATRRHRDSPRVRRLAAQHGVDLARVRPSGRHGRATLADVRAAVPAEPEAADPPRAPAQVAQLTTVIEVDLSYVVRTGELVLGFVAEAAVRALADHPVINAQRDSASDRRVDLGVVVETENGQVVPVIRGAHDLNVGALARRITDLVSRARDGSATASFAIANIGSRGALFDTPYLEATQSAILGLGSVVRRPVALIGADGDELVAVRSMAYLSMTYDPRRIHGGDAADFLASVKVRLESRDRVQKVTS